MLQIAPFSAGLAAIGKLFQIADGVNFNIENCNRVRRRAALLLPVLVTIWRQTAADRGCTVSESIAGAVRAMAETLEAMTEQIKNYCDSGFLKRAFKSGDFAANIEDLQRELDKHISVLQTALSADQGRKLDQLLQQGRELSVTINAQLDSVLATVTDTNKEVVELKAMLEAKSKEIMESVLKGEHNVFIWEVFSLYMIFYGPFSGMRSL